MLRDPRAGDNITADWARELVREIRRNRPVAGENTRVVVTPNGTVIHGTPGGDRGSSAASAPGRFAIVEHHDGDMKLKSCYYRVAGRTFALEDTETKIDVTDDCIVALVVTITDSKPSASVTTYSSLSDLQQAEKDTEQYIVPLYMIASGKIECDFRIGPDCAMGEFI